MRPALIKAYSSDNFYKLLRTPITGTGQRRFNTQALREAQRISESDSPLHFTATQNLQESLRTRTLSLHGLRKLSLRDTIDIYRSLKYKQPPASYQLSHDMNFMAKIHGFQEGVSRAISLNRTLPRSTKNSQWEKLQVSLGFTKEKSPLRDLNLNKSSGLVLVSTNTNLFEIKPTALNPLPDKISIIIPRTGIIILTDTIKSIRSNLLRFLEDKQAVISEPMVLFKKLLAIELNANPPQLKSRNHIPMTTDYPLAELSGKLQQAMQDDVM